MEQAQHVERKLVAILAADVVGYSRLMGLDEAGTLARLQSLRREFIQPLLEEHGGRVVKLMGDGALVAFASVVDAVACGVEIKKVVDQRNLDQPQDSRITFRIGINLGDVIIDGDDLYGDGVNIAARLEGICDPGGIFISGMAFDQAHNKLGVDFEPLGERHLKNIAEPVRVYRVLFEPASGARRLRSRRWFLPVVASLCVALAAGVAVVALPRLAAFLPEMKQGAERTAASKPSIAVLPFDDIGADAGQDYFTEGLTNDLITDLSKISGLFVIARESAFSFKGKSLSIRQIADQLDVRYVLEGSVRRAGSAVRINVELVEADTGRNIWAERYDRNYSDIFALQDEVIAHIVDALAVRLSEGEKTRIARLPTRNLEAYDFYTRAEQKVYAIDYRSLGEALSLYEKAIKLDPDFADAHTGYARAIVDVLGFDYQPLMLSAVARQRAYAAASRGLELNPQSSRAYSVLGILQMLDGEIDEAIASVKRAVALDPNGAEAELNLAIVLTYAGQNADALAEMERVLHLDPKPRAQVYDYYALVLYMNRRYEEALKALNASWPSEPSDLRLEVLAMVNARLGRIEEAHKVVEAILKRSPAQSLSSLRVMYSHHHRQEDLDHRLEALRIAGCSEWSYDFHGQPGDRLDAKAIQALVMDRTWSGHQYGGVPFFMELGENGDFAMRAQSSIIAGKFTIEGDFLCTQSPATLLGRKFCSPVYRNPGGTAAKQDEYVMPDSVSIWYFSAVR